MHLQVHTALTNLLLLLMLLLAVFLSLDYNLPIVWRDMKVNNSDSDWIAFVPNRWFTLMTPSSPLCWSLPYWFPSLPFSMLSTSGIPGCQMFPGWTSLKFPSEKSFKYLGSSNSITLFRVTIFWRNQLITPLAVSTILSIGVTIVAITSLTILGRCPLDILYQNFWLN